MKSQVFQSRSLVKSRVFWNKSFTGGLIGEIRLIVEFCSKIVKHHRLRRNNEPSFSRVAPLQVAGNETNSGLGVQVPTNVSSLEQSLGRRPQSSLKLHVCRVYVVLYCSFHRTALIMNESSWYKPLCSEGQSLTSLLLLRWKRPQSLVKMPPAVVGARVLPPDVYC